MDYIVDTLDRFTDKFKKFGKTEKQLVWLKNTSYGIFTPVSMIWIAISMGMLYLPEAI